MSTYSFPKFRTQRGAAAIEFALIALFILFPLLFATIELGRVLFYWNAATEATRLGARLAVVCDLGDSDIRRRMTEMFPPIANAGINIAYRPQGCTASTCQQVEVSIRAGEVRTYIPGIPLSLFFSSFNTTLPRESMRSNFGPTGGEVNNPVCL